MQAAHLVHVFEFVDDLAYDGLWDLVAPGLRALRVGPLQAWSREPGGGGKEMLRLKHFVAVGGVLKHRPHRLQGSPTQTC